MKMRRLAAWFLVLALALCTLPVSAAESGWLVPRVKDSPDFADVKGAWCESSVETVYEAGLMDGKSAAVFDPSGSLTYAQIVVITARLHSLLKGGNGTFAAPTQDQLWYQPALNYLKQQVDGSTEAGEYLLDMLPSYPYYADESCDRYDFVWYLAAVLPERALTPINSITALPDTSDSDVLRFYNAGILTGSDEYGTFDGTERLTRGQAAAMLARIVDPSQRVRFTPKTLVLSQAVLGLAPTDTVLTVDGYAVSAELYTTMLLNNILFAQMNSIMATMRRMRNTIRTI